MPLIQPNPALAIAVAILVGLILPALREWWKNRRSRKNLIRMLIANIDDEIKTLAEFEKGLIEAISKAKKDDHPDENKRYLPVVIEDYGIQAYIDWTAEKWMLPEQRAARILRFYNKKQTIATIIEFTKTEEYRNFVRERKIAVFLLILQRVQEAHEEGTALLALLNADGFIKE